MDQAQLARIVCTSGADALRNSHELSRDEI
jgi:hypothetical protein